VREEDDDENLLGDDGISPGHMAPTESIRELQQNVAWTRAGLLQGVRPQTFGPATILFFGARDFLPPQGNTKPYNHHLLYLLS